MLPVVNRWYAAGILHLTAVCQPNRLHDRSTRTVRLYSKPIYDMIPIVYLTSVRLSVSAVLERNQNHISLLVVQVLLCM